MLSKPLPISIRPRLSHDLILQTNMDTSSLPTDHHLTFRPTPGALPVDEKSPAANPPQLPTSEREITDITLKKVYHFLMDFSVMQLRKIARTWGRRQHGLKKAIVARIYVYILDRVEEDGQTVEDVLATNSKLHSFKTWEADMRLRVAWDKPPSRSELLTIIGGTHAGQEDQESDAVLDQSPGAATPGRIPPDSGLTLSEFARLLLLIKESEQIKQAIFEARKEVVREEEAVDRIRFWSTLIEPRFNDKSYMPLLQEEGPFEGIDARRMPSRYRSGNDLMLSFGAARQSFLVYLERWVKEGRSGDPATFADILPRNGRGGNISRTGKRSLMIFKIMKCWRETPDVVLLGLSIKFAGGPLMRVERMGGRGVSRKAGEDDDETDVDSEGRSTVRSKRRRRTSGKVEDSPNLGDYTKGLLEAIKAWSSGKETVQKTQEELAKEAEREQQEIRLRKLGEQADLLKAMEDARRMVRENEGDHELSNMAEMLYSELKTEFMNLRRC